MMTNVLQFTGDGFRSVVFSVVVLLSLSSSISPETVRLRSLRVLQKQVAAPGGCGSASPYYFIPGEGDRVGLARMAWEPGLGCSRVIRRGVKI